MVSELGGVMLGDDSPGQKRWAAVLFADLENFTALSESFGAERTYGLISGIVRQSWQLIERYQGCPIEYAGDSVLAAFGAPVAVENASLNACRAALALKEAMAARAQEFQSEFGIAPQFRIGIAGGVVAVGAFGMTSKMNVNLIGDTVNLAARIQGRAQPGEVLCSRSIFEQVDGLVRMTPLGPVDLKGFAASREIFRVEEWQGGATTFSGRLHRGSRVFVGREAELRRLRAWIEADPGRAGIFEISGPPGIGKSRLLFEALGAVPGRRVLQAQCNSDLSAKALAPVAQLLRAAVGWGPGDPPGALAAAIARLLPGRGDGAGQVARFLEDPDAWGRTADRDAALQTRHQIEHALHRLCADPGNLVVFEDVHWVDPVSAELLRGLAAKGPSGIKLLLTRRSDFRLADAPPGGVEGCALGPLSPEGIRAIAENMLGAAEIPDALLALLAETTEGNSLFVEETILYLRHSGQVAVSDGAVAFVPRPGEQGTAGNLQHLILSRYDTLGADARACILIAATKGRRFSEAFLARCMEGQGNIRWLVESAADAGLVEPDPDGGAGDWRFSHALVGTAIGESIFAQDRAAIHETVARGLERDAASVAENAEELFHHFDRAGNARKAIHYARKSAEKALAIYSIALADRALERAFDLIAADPEVVDDDEFATLLVLWAKTLHLYGNFRKLNAVIARHIDRLSRAGPSRALAICLTLKGVSRTHAGARDRALELIDKAAAVAETVGDRHSATWAKVARLRVLAETEPARLGKISALYDDIRAALDDLKDPVLLLMALYAMASAYRSNGLIRQSAGLVDEMEAHGRETGDTRALGMAAWARGLTQWFAEDFDGMAVSAAEGMKYCIAGTEDWRVAAAHRLVVDLIRRKPGCDPEQLLVVREEARANEDMVLCWAAGFQYCIHLMRYGRVRRSWRELRRLEQDALTLGSEEQKHQVGLLKARMLITLAGLEESDGARPRMAPGDIARALALRLTARRAAERLLREILARDAWHRGITAAHIHYGLGLIARAGSRKAEALECFRTSHALFADQGLDKRAEQCLAHMRALQTKG